MHVHTKVEEVSPVEKKLAVEVDWPYVAAKLDEAYRELSRGVALRGFRKGKVPRSILEQMFAKQVEREVAQKLFQESFLHALQKHELMAVAEPIVDDYELRKGTGFRFNARVEVRAPIEPKEYDGVALEEPAPAVSDEEVQRALEAKREDLTQYRKIEGRDLLAASDVAAIDLKGEIAGKPYSRDGMMVDLGRAEHAPIPGLAGALIGVAVGARDHEVTLELPRLSGDGGEAAPQAQLKITVREAREKLMPALDDDFAKDTGEADTLEELRGKLREQLLERKRGEAKDELKKELVREILRRNPFPVPPVLVERQTDVALQRAKISLALRGVDPKAASLDERRMRDELRPGAMDEVRRWFLLDAIADKEKVEVSEADLEKRLAELARERDKSVPRLKAELQKEGHLESLKHSLREEKTLDLLLTRANITSNSPSEKTE